MSPAPQLGRSQMHTGGAFENAPPHCVMDCTGRTKTLQDVVPNCSESLLRQISEVLAWQPMTSASHHFLTVEDAHSPVSRYRAKGKIVGHVLGRRCRVACVPFARATKDEQMSKRSDGVFPLPLSQQAASLTGITFVHENNSKESSQLEIRIKIRSSIHLSPLSRRHAGPPHTLFLQLPRRLLQGLQWAVISACRKL